MMLKKFILVLLVLFVLPSAFALDSHDIFKNLHDVNADFGHGSLKFDVCNPTSTDYTVKQNTFSHIKNAVRGDITAIRLFYNDSENWDEFENLPKVLGNTCYEMMLEVDYDMIIDEQKGTAEVSVDWIPNIKFGAFEFQMNEWAWFNASWGYRQRINFSSAVATNLTDYPFYFEFDTQSLIPTKMNDTCKDLRIALENTTLIDYDLQHGCNTSTTGVWAKLPTLATENTTYAYIYYGNTEVESTHNPDIVWSDYNYVIHKEETSSNATDSSPQGNDFAPNGDITRTYTGVFGNAYDYDGSGDYLTDGNTDNISISDFTISAWVNTAGGFINGDVIVAKSVGGGASTSYGYVFAIQNFGSPTNSVPQLIWSTSGVHAQAYANDVAFPTNQWVHISAVIDRDSDAGTKVFQDGDDTGSGEAQRGANTGAINNSEVIAIGSESDGTSDFPARIDEVRIRYEAMSDDWVIMDYKQGVDTFYSIGTEEEGNIVPTISDYNLTPNFVCDTVDLEFNLTCIDDLSTNITYWVNILNNSLSWLNQTGNITNNTNTIIYTLDNSNTTIGENWTGIFWCGDGTLNTTTKQESVPIIECVVSGAVVNQTAETTFLRLQFPELDVSIFWFLILIGLLSMVVLLYRA